MRYFPPLRKILFASAPGAYTMYWAMIIGIIIMSGYLVGGLVPKRFPNLIGKPVGKLQPRTFSGSQAALQMRSLDFKELPTATPTATSASSIAQGAAVSTATPKPTATPATCQGGNVALAFLLDASSSMDFDNRMAQLKTGLRNFDSKIPDTALVSITSFANDADVLLPFGKMGQVRGQYEYAVSRLQALGPTAMRRGMQAVLQQIRASQPSHTTYSYFVILVTDGAPDTDQSPLEPPDITKQIKDLHVKIYSIGVGVNTGGGTELILQQIASTPASKYYIPITNINQLGSIFSSLQNGLCS